MTSHRKAKHRNTPQYRFAPCCGQSAPAEAAQMAAAHGSAGRLTGHATGLHSSMRMRTGQARNAPIARPCRLQMDCGRISPKIRMAVTDTRMAVTSSTSCELGGWRRRGEGVHEHHVHFQHLALTYEQRMRRLALACDPRSVKLLAPISASALITLLPASPCTSPSSSPLSPPLRPTASTSFRPSHLFGPDLSTP